jgi:hypothetical protein
LPFGVTRVPRAVRVRVPPLLFSNYLQEKFRDVAKLQFTIRALYTNYYTNVLREHHTQPFYPQALVDLLYLRVRRGSGSYRISKVIETLCR